MNTIILSLIKLTRTIHICSMYINIMFILFIVYNKGLGLGGVLVVCGECYNLG